MADARIDEDGLTRRRHKLSMLKEKRGLIKDIGDLKDHPSWLPLKTILLKRIKNQDKIIDALLDADNTDESFVEAKKARAVKLIVEAIYKFVEENEATVAGLDSEVASLQDEIKKIEDGELV